MDKTTERAYKRSCFHGRSILALWLDRTFFALLGGACLYLLKRDLLLCGSLSLSLLLFFSLLDRDRWARYRNRLYQDAAKTLRREDWLRQEASKLRQAGGTPVFPTPDLEGFTGLCVRLGTGTAFHCFGKPKSDLQDLAKALGCTVTFHPWGEGTAPSRERIEERLKRNAPKQDRNLWRQLLHVPENRYLLAGCGMLLLSVFLRNALYWRLLGSLCLMIGAIRRGFLLTKTT